MRLKRLGAFHVRHPTGGCVHLSCVAVSLMFLLLNWIPATLCWPGDRAACKTDAVPQSWLLLSPSGCCSSGFKVFYASSHPSEQLISLLQEYQLSGSHCNSCGNGEVQLHRTEHTPCRSRHHSHVHAYIHPAGWHRDETVTLWAHPGLLLQKHGLFC